jgi:putative ubiquitin-RnfH superfamily antitoxin RatB of RatAB toxin-antitoxin module
MDEHEHNESVIEVVYARPDVQEVVRLKFELGLTAEQAVRRSGLTEQHPEITQRPLVLGCYGIPIANDARLRPGDRVEICRPLRMDPRDMRKDLAAKGRVIGDVPDDD